MHPAAEKLPCTDAELEVLSFPLKKPQPSTEVPFSNRAKLLKDKVLPNETPVRMDAIDATSVSTHPLTARPELK